MFLQFENISIRDNNIFEKKKFDNYIEEINEINSNIDVKYLI